MLFFTSSDDEHDESHGDAEESSTAPTPAPEQPAAPVLPKPEIVTTETSPADAPVSKPEPTT